MWMVLMVLWSFLLSWSSSFVLLHKPPPTAYARAYHVPLYANLKKLDLSIAASQAQNVNVEEMLRLAGVPVPERCFHAFPGLHQCHPQDEVLRRLEHLNFLIEQGVYTFDVAMELIASQPRFLQMRFGVVYEDDDLFVMDKPADLRMDLPQRENEGRKWPTEYTCSDWLDSVIVPPLDKKRFCHNLDSATSGILCVAKNQQMAAKVVDLFAQRQVQKEYLALVFGHVETPDNDGRLLIEAPIEKDPNHGFRMCIGPGGKAAQTHVEVLARGYLNIQGPHFNAPISKLRLKPVSGRRHQLRVHTALAMGHGMVGDTYVEDWSTYRLMLHAHKLRLPLDPNHPLQLATPDPFEDFLSPLPVAPVPAV